MRLIAIATAIAALTLGGCGTVMAPSTSLYNPQTGQRLAAVEGDCAPGDTDGQGRICACVRDHGRYVDCHLQFTGRAAPRPQYGATYCLASPCDYQSCLAGGCQAYGASYPYYGHNPYRGDLGYRGPSYNQSTQPDNDARRRDRSDLGYKGPSEHYDSGDRNTDVNTPRRRH